MGKEAQSRSQPACLLTATVSYTCCLNSSQYNHFSHTVILITKVWAVPASLQPLGHLDLIICLQTQC